MTRIDSTLRTLVRSAAAVVALFALGCAGDAPADGPAQEAQNAAAAAEAPAGPPSVAVGHASLSIGGGQVAYPGRFDLLASCTFDDGILTLVLVSAGDIIGGPNAATLTTGAAAPVLAPGAYAGRYDVTEEHEDGNVERYAGDIEIVVTALEPAADGPVATIQAEGTGDDGVAVELSARCVVP